MEACAFGARLGNQSVFILDPRLFLTYFVVRRGRFLSWKNGTEGNGTERNLPGYVNLSKVIFRDCD